MRGCWTTVRHSADDSGAGLSRISSGTATLPTSWSRAATRMVDLGVRQLEPAGHLDNDRGDERGRLAAVMRERRDVRGENVRRRVPGLPSDLDRAGAALV